MCINNHTGEGAGPRVEARGGCGVVAAGAPAGGAAAAGARARGEDAGGGRSRVAVSVVSLRYKIQRCIPPRETPQ